MRCLTEHRPGSGLAAVVVAVPAGSDHDPAGAHGMAHLVEHLFFARAEGQDGAVGHAAAVARIGGTTNAETHRDHTIYHSLVPAEQLEALADLELDRLSAALTHTGDGDAPAPPGGVSREAEVEVIAAEVVAAGPEPSTWDAARALLFPDSRDGLGSPAALRHVTPAEVAAWFGAHYRPDRIVVSVVGDVPAGRLTAVQQTITSTLAASTSPAWVRAPFAALRATSDGLVVRGSLRSRFHGLVVSHVMADPVAERRRYLAQVVLSQVLMRSVLPATVRQHPRWLAASIACGFRGQFLTSRSPDLFHLTMAHPPGAPRETVVRQWRETLDRAAEEFADPVRAARAVNTLLLSWHRGSDSLIGRASHLARGTLLLDDSGTPDDLAPALASVSYEEIRDAVDHLHAAPTAVLDLSPDAPVSQEDR